MKKIVRIHEICVTTYPDGDYVIVQAVVSHSRHLVKKQIYRIEFHMPTAKAAQIIADEHMCDEWSYQTAWFTPRVEPAQLVDIASSVVED